MAEAVKPLTKRILEVMTTCAGWPMDSRSMSKDLNVPVEKVSGACQSLKKRNAIKPGAMKGTWILSK
jgi:hypothetical protein